jgi:legumain
MLFDDVANSKENPFPGKLFNHPNGSDVYEGLKIDYKGNDANAQNFLAVLQGQKDKVNGGRVIER